MRICYLNHDLKNTTGAGRFGLALVGEMENIFPEAEITVLTSEASGNPWELPVIRAGIFGFAASVFRVRRIIKSSDIVHALDGWPYGVVAALASFGLKKKLIITAIGSGAVAPLYNFWRRSLTRWAYRRADVLTAISRNTKNEILRVVPDLDIKVINHGVNFSKFQDTSPKLQDTRYRPYILSVGTLKKRKGYEYSIKAFAEVAERFPELKYIIVGKGEEKENLKFQVSSSKPSPRAQAEGLQDRVIFLDNLSEEELIGLYHNAELFILLPQDVNKDMEGFGLVFLEAAACGLPVVATKNGSAEDAVLDGQNGILVPPQNAAAAAEALIKILSDSLLKESMSKESVAFAQKMSWRKTAFAYAKLYK